LKLTSKFCGLNFKNPLVLASGVLGVTGETLLKVIRNGAGGVTTKSIWLKAHKGHKNPVMFSCGEVFMNAVGLSDAGFEKAKEEITIFKKKSSQPLIVNIVASKIKDFGLLAKKISTLNPDLIEVNISCPNVEDEFGKPFACDIFSAEKVVKIIRKNTKNNFSVKLSPNVNNIGEIAKACEAGGANAITAINTVGPGMRINIETKTPILKNKVGGISGPGIFPIAIKCVNDIYRSVKLPIIGIGGVKSGEDAIEMMMAGASLVGICTGVYLRGISVFKKVCQEMEKWSKKNNIKSLSEIIGSVKID